MEGVRCLSTQKSPFKCGVQYIKPIPLFGAVLPALSSFRFT